MRRKEFADKLFPSFCQVHGKMSAILFAPFAPDKPTFFQVVNNQGHIATALKDLRPDLDLGHRPKMIQCLKRAKLANR